MNFSIDFPKDDLDETIAAPLCTVQPPANYKAPSFTEPCTKCGGTGRYQRLGACFKCNGTGKLTFKQPREKRMAGRAAVAKRKERTAAENLEAFKASHPDIFAWFDGSEFPFAVAMREAVAKWGHLTERQEVAARGAMEKRAAAQQEKAERLADTKPVNMDAIERAFAAANKSLKRPKLRVAGFTLSIAPATSRNAGALYIKGDNGLYLGKILSGSFTRSRDCTTEQAAEVLKVAADPKGAAIAYGRLTGSCACCGRPLTNKESVELGIGPICAEKFAF